MPVKAPKRHEDLDARQAVAGARAFIKSRAAATMQHAPSTAAAAAIIQSPPARAPARGKQVQPRCSGQQQIGATGLNLTPTQRVSVR